MFDLLATLGSAVLGDIIKRTIAAGIEWGKRRKKPQREEVKQKIEELVANAAKEAAITETLPIQERQRLVNGIAELTLPTFEQVVQYSPNTARTVYAVKKAAPKKAAAKKKFVAKKAPAKKAAAKKSAPKRHR